MTRRFNDLRHQVPPPLGLCDLGWLGGVIIFGLLVIAAIIFITPQARANESCQYRTDCTEHAAIVSAAEQRAIKLRLRSNRKDIHDSVSGMDLVRGPYRWDEVDQLARDALLHVR
jgi:hypothetical protein